MYRKACGKWEREPGKGKQQRLSRVLRKDDGPQNVVGAPRRSIPYRYGGRRTRPAGKAEKVHNCGRGHKQLVMPQVALDEAAAASGPIESNVKLPLQVNGRSN